MLKGDICELSDGCAEAESSTCSDTVSSMSWYWSCTSVAGVVPAFLWLLCFVPWRFDFCGSKLSVVSMFCSGIGWISLEEACVASRSGMSRKADLSV